MMKVIYSAASAARTFRLPTRLFHCAPANSRNRTPDLQSSFTPLIIANADGFIHASQKDLAIADFPGTGSTQNGLHGLVHHRVSQHHLQLGLGDQVHTVLTASIDFGVAFLASVASNLEHGHALDTD